MIRKTLIFALFAASLISCTREPVQFAFISDVHLSVGASSRIENLEKCIEDINANDEIKFVMFGGDITEFGADEEIALAKEVIDQLNKPTYVLAGNHDAKWSESGCNTFAKVFGYEQFEFEAGGIKFIGCNSGPNMRMAPALLPHESLVWLDSIVTATPKSKKMIFVNHYPQDTSMLNYFQVINTLKRGNIQMLIGGHWHSNTILDYNGVPGVLGRAPDSKKELGYNIFTIANDSIKVSEKILRDRDKNPVNETREPWFAMALHDKPIYTPDVPSDGNRYGVPDDFAWLKFDVNEKYPEVKSVWEQQDVSDVGSGAVIEGDLVLYTNTQGSIKALKLSDGTPVWSFATEGKAFSTPASDGERVVAGSSDGNVYCVSLVDGSLIWKYKCEKSVLASPVIMDGIAYVGSSDHVFRAIKIDTGELVWQFDGVKGFVECKPFIDKDQVVFGDWANTLYSLNPVDGELQWTWANKGSRMLSPAATYPVKANGKIFFATPERKTYAIDAKTGKQVWVEKGGRESIALSCNADKVFSKVMFGTMEAFSTQGQKAKKLWEVVVPRMNYEIAPTPCATAMDGDRELLFVPTDKGNIYCLDAADGSVIWVHKISVAMLNSIVPMENRQLLISTMDGLITVLSY